MKQGNKKISLVGPIAELVAIVILLLGVTYAWFYQGNTALVGPMNLPVISAFDVSIKKQGDENWGIKLDINGDPNVRVPISEYSGNGRQLFRPVYNMRKLVGFSEVTSDSEEKFIEFQITVRADANVGLYLTSDSYVKPASVGSTEDSPEEFGEREVPKHLTREDDIIAGAVRIALFDPTTNSTVLWAPNSQYDIENKDTYEDKDGNKVTAPVTVGTPESKYSYIKSAVDLTQMTIASNEQFNDQFASIGNSMATIPNAEHNASGVYKNEDVCFIWGDPGADSEKIADPVIVLNGSTGQPEEKTLTVRVWIEGCDREAVKEYINGEFRINLDFRAEDMGLID